ncbi:hypothetical protein JFX23_06385 [Schaalia cardiffensis]|uniref:hypothetical protein n=1 Tax=Schaalia cardiffensis TaxID=181487 RepID=UPI0013F3DD32|nr:hypothetical protein [Schaalia cardiffensis]MBJ2329394.1 hypothetical protein [Schaalia cardiffensis]
MTIPRIVNSLMETPVDSVCGQDIDGSLLVNYPEKAYTGWEEPSSRAAGGKLRCGLTTRPTQL